jgi:hypothetical protein
MIDLHKFCADERDSREYLRAPWRQGEWVYATNGHLVVRVPAAAMPDAVEGGPLHPNTAAMFAKHLESGDREFLPMPAIAEPDKCKHCGGKSVMWAAPCPDCEDGALWHGSHEYDCKNCHGSDAGPGWVDSSKDNPEAKEHHCGACDFRGYSLRINGSQQLGEAHYANVYLWHLAQLPKCRICPGDTAEKGAQAGPAALIFDGGQALLMPTRP